MWIWRLNSGRRARSQVQAWSRKLTQCLRDDARRNSPGGHSARSRGKDLPCIVKPTYTGYQIFLHTTLQTPNPVCTCISTSAYMYVFSSITVCYHHNITRIHAYLSFPVTHGRTAFGIVANVPRHPRGGTGRLPWGPPRPSDICCTCTQSAIVSCLNGLRPRSLGSHGPCYWFTNVCNSYIAQ